MVNYNQTYLESLVNQAQPGFQFLLIIVKSLVSLVQPGFTRLTRLLTRLLVLCDIRSLIHLSHLDSEVALSMRKCYDQVVGHVRSVESMGEKFRFETLAPVLVPLIVDKLPKGLVEKWE